MAPTDQGKVIWGSHTKSSFLTYTNKHSHSLRSRRAVQTHNPSPVLRDKTEKKTSSTFTLPNRSPFPDPLSPYLTLTFPMDERALCQLNPEKVLGWQRSSGDLSMDAFMCVHVSGCWSSSYVALDGERDSCRQRGHMRSGRAAVATVKGVQDSFICFRWGNIRPAMSILLHLTAFKWLMWSQTDMTRKAGST